ncbi:Ca2+-binding RTX toxin-like protein [Sulfitobacter undariae]|uniref:Ca2+-binding RTX toxin-like protein n=1 Tax=Sulfitobacter undariae TaxID=1563671 RepID=A0A7W6GZ98_9RHOB|nr:hypothetical protein [Sulfitobacter undariae]MBB3993245.1 Ca2+-binding RTX toxin-like protein [Sulfitobacter undariae]
MSGLALLSILGFALVLPLFLNDDEDDDDNVTTVDPVDLMDPVSPVTPAPPVTPPTLEGPTLNGTAGDDVLAATDKTTNMYGFAGDDTMEIFGAPNIVADGGLGDDQITYEPTDAADTGSVTGGAGDDTIDTFGIGGSVSGGLGDDVINVQGTLNGVEGGEGNDTINSDSADYGGGTPLDGGAGDDLITLTNSPGIQIGSAVDGGAGDDTIASETILNSGTTYDTLTGGAGDDSFELSFVGSSLTDGSTDAGIVTTITDFTPGVDVLSIVNQSDLGTDSPPITLGNVSLSEAPDGSFTDVIFTTSPDQDASPLTGTVRLMGTTGLTLDDLKFDADSVTTEGSEGNDTLSSTGRFDPPDTIRGN